MDHELEKQPRVKQRRKNGSVIIEFASCCFMFVIFAAVAADVCVILYSAFSNDRACRDAARAASMGKDPAEAKNLANGILTAHAHKFSLASSPTLGTDFIYQDYSGQPPAGKSPFVQLSTKSTAKMPFGPVSVLHCFFGNGKVNFSQTYAYPIVRMKRPV